MPEALSIIEMVMSSDHKHCRYVKVNRFLDQSPHDPTTVTGDIVTAAPPIGCSPRKDNL
ncbi:hypothetical protein ACFTS5_05910 [Nocardia sp. NPDC056952]|uniref:hypothetical protein n=1 Tax=Nocardia sp. NPDC056952 TaxID=3345979 RepID=UPI003639C5CB